MVLACFASNAQDVISFFAAAIRDRAGILLASLFDRDVRPSANRVLHSQAHAAMRSVFKCRGRGAGTAAFLFPQNIHPRHEWNPEFAPLFAHTLPIGKKSKQANRLVVEFELHRHSCLCGFLARQLSLV
jgi:hypothetical protein